MARKDRDLYKPVIYILAAGNGSRLYPFTRSVPKPLLRVSYKKRVSFWAFKVGQNSDLPVYAGVKREHRDLFAKAYSSIPVGWLETPADLESGGSFLHNARKLQSLGYTHAVVIPGDYYIHFDAHRLLEEQRNTNLDICLLTSSRYPYFEYLAFSNKRLVEIQATKNSPISYIGIYSIKLEALSELTDPIITNTQILNRLLAKGKKAGFLEHADFWTDLGTRPRFILFMFKYNLHRLWRSLVRILRDQSTKSAIFDEGEVT